MRQEPKMRFQERTDWLKKAPSSCMAVYYDGQFIVEKHTTDEHPCLECRLVIKCADRKPMRDWRILQDIKNAVVGEERLAIEMYPLESQGTDTGNLYHLWVLREGHTIPCIIVPPCAPSS